MRILDLIFNNRLQLVFPILLNYSCFNEIFRARIKGKIWIRFFIVQQKKTLIYINEIASIQIFAWLDY